ncbi:hypothetical protein [Achromobacter xylosoxidans]|uniref:hypothetical protein n=1 Tax=Alcaligenes xylosoxydans xylosoxydans TaxID=85698 RepID=UPI00131D58CA|nr:hypothetical protein [Achromobacter xylosoxidans]
MTYLSRQQQGRPALLLAGLILFPLAAAQAAAPTVNQANVNLETDISTMAIHVGQSAPLPPGGCNAGYAWHTTYGGCRIAQKQSESAQCPGGQTGTRKRERIAYALQADPGNVVYEDWDAWIGECRASAPPASGECRYEPGKTEIVFFRLPGGDPVTVVQWQGAIVVNSAVHTYGQIPGYDATRGLLNNGWWYRSGALIPTQGDSFDTTAYEVCREPSAPPPSPVQVTFTVLKRPSGVSCRFTEFKVRANYPDGSIAIGVPLKWTVVWRGALSSYETVTDSRGEASTYATRFDGNMNIRVRVNYGATSQEIRGICIGGT